MENLKYISANQRLEIVKTYIEEYIAPGESNLDSDINQKVEAFLFEDPNNRRLVDRAIEEADYQVDLERYAQYSQGWYRDVARYFFEKSWVSDRIGSVLKASDIPTDTCNLQLSEENLVYLGTVMLLTTRGGVIRDEDIKQAKFVASKILNILKSEDRK